ncbi:FtsP/CotA-like multicopper oxidase with cupredoxin domain [Geodermatophilus normandii]|uniref:FtsP/CotA-like multicopper oxidase with cupredoxin domain n=1 Tax=Geodermatophilus normandii TaxID=1137989 RepID=A0A317QQD0_9ACTN|nr:multicopper oxidase domain-containing protein [Geodermatophilus normandii]PWW25204.1 FtsP/CotA-like multicopper oxidase with cupredoxin domain [Geodermatophilus normandii]
MASRSYDVVATSMPIVYNVDGDHDPNGLLYALEAHRPLLDWVRARWEDEDGYLPRLHLRTQRIQVLVDDLRRYEETVLGHRHDDRRVARTLDEEYEETAEDALIDREVLQELRVHQGRSRAAPDGDEGPRRGASPRVQSIERHVRGLVDRIATLLDLLTDGQVRALPVDPETGRPDVADLLKRWRLALENGRRGIEAWFERVEADPLRRFDADRLSAASGLPAERVRRLLLNDHADDDWRRARAAGADRELLDEQDRVRRYTRFNPMKPVPLVRPLVLRAHEGETVRIRLQNSVRGRRVGLHLQGDGISTGLARGVRHDDGAAVGVNDPSTVRPGGCRTFLWNAGRQGVWYFNDLADLRGTQAGTNAHGLFGALVVEPPGVRWHDPETGEDLTRSPYGDGLDVDIRVPGEQALAADEYVDLHTTLVSHREFTIFFHDEPEVHSAFHVGDVDHTVMPISYRAEPMPNRLPHRMRRLAEQPTPGRLSDTGVDLQAVGVEYDTELGEVFRTARRDGRWLEYVAGEEQHHSSWLFGDPAIPVVRAYAGDPARVRLVHGGVKETHVFHLHVHQWRAVATDTALPGEAAGSQLLDAITIGPQTAITIDPLYGSGSRQRAVGDIIWHCHLYPHFHHGMWGLWRSFDQLVDGRRLLPDGAPCAGLQPLPGRPPDADRLGFPWFVDATFPQKAPPPPAWEDEHVVGRRRLLYGIRASAAEEAAGDPGCAGKPGSFFIDLDTLAATWNQRAGLPGTRLVQHDIEVREKPVRYNPYGWHDPHGHHYVLKGATVDGVPQAVPGPPTEPDAIEPLYTRANQGDVLESRFTNGLQGLPPDAFDHAQLPVECALHVHLTKFDVLAADGSSTGWNYLSGTSCDDPVLGLPEAGPRQLPPNVGFHRWVVDEEFGPCFFHDHLLANYRQKHGLFAALNVEPHGSRWLTPHTWDPAADAPTDAWTGSQAVIAPGPDGRRFPAFREACLAVADFVPLFDEHGDPLNPPGELGGDDDPGAMAVNYRCEPLTKRGEDPSRWFSSRSREDEDRNDPAAGQPAGDRAQPRADGADRHGQWGREDGDPATPVISTYPGERLRLRLVQGSHEEQHSFVLHGLRWRRDWLVPESTLVDQQTIGISEAFTVEVPALGDERSYGPGDHLWRFAAIDDTWLGCWGLIRALPPTVGRLADVRSLHGDRHALLRQRPVPPRPHRRPDGTYAGPVRDYVVVARRREIRYDGTALTDPWGLVYQRADRSEPVAAGPGAARGDRRAVGVHDTGEPLVLRAHPGEWIRVTLLNEVLLPEDEVDPYLPRFGPELLPPRVPLDERVRTVSPRVSLHACLLGYDVVSDDGSHVGFNRDSTVAPLAVRDDHGHEMAADPQAGIVVDRADHRHGASGPNWREYWWYADDGLAPAGSMGQVCYLHDTADVRNHPHHGLVGAVVVEPRDLVPVHPRTGAERWSGTHVLLRRGGETLANEQVLFVRDGMRHFVAGNPLVPVPDVEIDVEAEDSGQKGVGYGSAVVHHPTGMARSRPPTPVWAARVGDTLWLRLVGAADKPRNHTFTLHGLAWPAAPWVRDGRSVDWLGSLSGLTAATVHDIELTATRSGDHAYRTGVLKWALEQGIWGILRVERPGVRGWAEAVGTVRDQLARLLGTEVGRRRT